MIIKGLWLSLRNMVFFTATVEENPVYRPDCTMTAQNQSEEKKNFKHLDNFKINSQIIVLNFISNI